MVRLSPLAGLRRSTTGRNPSPAKFERITTLVLCQPINCSKGGITISQINHQLRRSRRQASRLTLIAAKS
jgi:hypothetical protein